MKHQTPEGREIEKKRQKLFDLENVLSQRELDLATLHRELHIFERRYLRIVGSRYAELDEIEAQIAETIAEKNPKNKQKQKTATESRYKANESAGSLGDISKDSETTNKFAPSENLKRLFREVAKAVHPDLATDEEERIRREKLMVEANRAYEEGDENTLGAILSDWETSPESVKGEGVGVELVRIIRKIDQIERRIAAIDKEIKELQRSDLFKLKVKVEDAMKENRDFLSEMAERLDREIEDARKRLYKIKEG